MRAVIAHLLWPLLVTVCIAGYWYGGQVGHPVLAFNITYFGLAVTLLILERVMPYEQAWMASDGQLLNDIAHTVLNKGLGQVIAASIAMLGLAQAGPAAASGFWPGDWPLGYQVLLAMILGEFGLYWAHRTSHEFRVIWHWHAIHHSVTKLWIVNTGRFHFLDSIWKTAFALTIAALAGAPKDVIVWVLAITTYIGFLTHCNVDMRCGPLNWIFSTPELHRWHHNRDPVEGNVNYGENFILWDVVFGTRHLPSDRKPPVNIGCKDAVPDSFLGQLAYPFQAWARRDFYNKKKAA